MRNMGGIRMPTATPARLVERPAVVVGAREEWLRPSEAAARAGVANSRMYKALYGGECAGFWVNGGLRVPSFDLAAWERGLAEGGA